MSCELVGLVDYFVFDLRPFESARDVVRASNHKSGRRAAGNE